MRGQDRGSVFRSIAISCCLTALAVPVFADEDMQGAPYISGTAEFEIQTDHTVRSDDPAMRMTDTGLTAEMDVALWLTSAVSINANVAFDPVVDPGPGEDRFFEGQGLHLDELFIRYRSDRFSLSAGKITPIFGTAPDEAPGIYGTDLAGDYEIEEQIGIAGSVVFNGGSYGEHIVTASAFFADTTILSNSALTKRGRLDRSDGGVGNTGDISSFALAATGGGFTDEFDLNYRASLSYRAAGQTERHNEVGLAFALEGTVTMAPDVEWIWLAEAAHLRHFQGDGDDYLYLTAGGELQLRNWRIAPVITLRKTTSTSEPADLLATLHLGYEFEHGLEIGTAYKYVHETGLDSHIVGLRVKYGYEF